MRIVSWNVNSVRARLANVTDFLIRTAPDIVGVQELKCLEEAFPYDAIEDSGYRAYVKGQKSYNGVAFLSKTPVEDVVSTLPGFEADEQARYIEGAVSYDSLYLKIINCYMPNGNPLGSEKYTYKLNWLRALQDRVKNALKDEEDFILCGDFNIIPEARDVKNPDNWRGDALFQQEVREIYREFLYLGLTDAVRALHPSEEIFTFWDYQGGARRKNDGIRIDHFLLSPRIADRLQSVRVLDGERDKEKASDHAPVMIELA